MPLAHFHIVTHSNAASFSRIVILCETTFSVAENIDFGTKLMPYSESSTKIKLSHVRQFSKFCSCQQLFAFKDVCMETRLRNISKTRNDTDFNKTILEILYKVLLATCSLTALKWPIFLLTGLGF